MMSELGCAYFFDSTHEKKTLSVYTPVSAAPVAARGEARTNLEGVHVGAIAAGLDGVDGPDEQVPRLHVQVQDVGRAQFVEDPPEGRAFGPQEEELGPEAVRLFGVVALGRLRRQYCSLAVRLRRVRGNARSRKRPPARESATNLQSSRLAGSTGFRTRQSPRGPNEP